MTSSLSYLDSKLSVDSGGLVLELTQDSPTHTNIIPVGGDKPLYTVSTQYAEKKNPTTIVFDSSGNLLASLEWRNVLADIVRYGDEKAKPLRITSWMSCGIFTGNKVTFKDEQGRKYQWQGYASWGRNVSPSLSLYADDSPDQPIVTYLRPPGVSKPSDARPEEQRSKLILQPRALEIQDLAVVSWLFFEKARRAKLHRGMANHGHASLLGISSAGF